MTSKQVKTAVQQTGHDIVLDRQATPPVTPNLHDRYIIAPSATGAWVGQDNNITFWNGAAWEFVSPETGLIATLTVPQSVWQYDNPTWSTVVPSTLAELNVAITDAVIDDAGDARDPLAHAATHQDSGGDEIASATAAANAIPKATANGVFDATWTARAQHLRVGSDDGQEYASIKAACDSITDASITKPYVVTVCPGVYNEAPFTVPAYVAVIGAGDVNSLVIDISGYWEDITPLGGEDRGNNTHSAIFRGVPGVTGIKLFDVNVTTSVSAI